MEDAVNKEDFVIENIQKTVLDMTDDELMEQVKLIRSRRFVPKTAVVEKRAAKKKLNLAEKLKNLTPEQKEKLKQLLTGGISNGR
jgi:hypothetical protein